MKTNKITHSKCPNCKKHGLPIYKTRYKYNPVITCKFCDSKFKVNRALSMTVLIVLAVVVGVGFRTINENWFNIPTWICYFIGVALWFVFEYFAPLEECDEEE